MKLIRRRQRWAPNGISGGNRPAARFERVGVANALCSELDGVADLDAHFFLFSSLFSTCCSRWFSRSTSVFPSPASPTRSPSQRLPTPRPRRLCLSFTSTLAVTSTACSLRPSRGVGLLLHPFFRPSRGKGDGFLLALNLVGLRPFIHPPVATLTLQQSTEIWHTKTRIKTR